MENLEQERLQWIKGDKIGTVETVKGIDGEWTTFESGRRINTGLIPEFLMAVNGEPLDFSETPPNPALQKAAKTYKEKAVSPPTASPIRTLFDKQKKNDKIKLNLSFPIEVPKEGIYEIISSSFDVDEVNTELESFIKDQISESLIKDSLIQSITELISSRYKID
jgi:hypothetical protein